MNSNLIKLEFDKILQILSSYCKTYIVKNLISNLLPSSDPIEVRKHAKTDI